jgi:2-polyprenyl-6-methoxyphenol hydroxylase-like FAD-dependent oxidoreductase
MRLLIDMADSHYIPSVLIIGSGISGLTAGLFLMYSIPNVKPIILERHSSLFLTGGAILLPPNATRVFDSVGLLESLKSIAEDASTHLLRRGNDGKVIQRRSTEPNGNAPYLVVMRGEFMIWLFARLRERGGTVKFGKHVVKIEEQQETIELVMPDGEVLASDLVIVADGNFELLHSIGETYTHNLLRHSLFSKIQHNSF